MMTDQIVHEPAHKNGTTSALITKGNAALVTAAFASGLVSRGAGAPEMVRGSVASVGVNTRLVNPPLA